MKMTYRVARISAGLSQKEAARRLGVNHCTLSSWETGAHQPRIHHLMAMADLYGVEFSDFLIPTESNKIGQEAI